jgi:hypothetical protein
MTTRPLTPESLADHQDHAQSASHNDGHRAGPGDRGWRRRSSGRAGAATDETDGMSIVQEG